MVDRLLSNSTIILQKYLDKSELYSSYKLVMVANCFLINSDRIMMSLSIYNIFLIIRFQYGKKHCILKCHIYYKLVV